MSTLNQDRWRGAGIFVERKRVCAGAGLGTSKLKCTLRDRGHASWPTALNTYYGDHFFLLHWPHSSSASASPFPIHNQDKQLAQCAGLEANEGQQSLHAEHVGQVGQYSSAVS